MGLQDFARTSTFSARIERVVNHLGSGTTGDLRLVDNHLSGTTDIIIHFDRAQKPISIEG